jgi:hypothetical protein
MWKKYCIAGRATDDYTVHVHCMLAKATDTHTHTHTHTQYVILHVFPLQQWLHERALMLHYITRTLPRTSACVCVITMLCVCVPMSAFNQFVGF